LKLPFVSSLCHFNLNQNTVICYNSKKYEALAQKIAERDAEEQARKEERDKEKEKLGVRRRSSNASNLSSKFI